MNYHWIHNFPLVFLSAWFCPILLLSAKKYAADVFVRGDFHIDFHMDGKEIKSHKKSVLDF